MKLIQGFFIQKTENLLGIAFGEEGEQATIRKAVCPFMYAGTIHQIEGGWEGEMIDPQGQSNLFDIVISDAYVSFKKQYVRHRHQPHAYIIYSFHTREDNTWVGAWRHPKGQGGDWGPSRCIITDLDERLLQKDVINFLKNLPPEDFDPEKVKEFEKRLS